MLLLPPRATRTVTLLPDLTRFRSDRHPAGGRQSRSSEIGTALNAVAQNCFRGRGAVIRRRGALAMTLGALVAVTGFMDQGIIATRAAVELPVRALKITLSKSAREDFVRSEARSVGKACVSTCRSRGSQDH